MQLKYSEIDAKTVIGQLKNAVIFTYPFFKG